MPRRKSHLEGKAGKTLCGRTMNPQEKWGNRYPPSPLSIANSIVDCDCKACLRRYVADDGDDDRPFSIDGVSLYRGDSRKILPEILAGKKVVVLTDPVWPNAIPQLAGFADPIGLLRDTLAAIAPFCDRLAIQMGCNSDPRFLAAVPSEFEFFRTVHMKYVCPYYRGRLL